MPGPPLRVIRDDGWREPTRNLAVDEALARTAGPEPVLRLWRNDPCVVVGRFQLASAEVDRATADRLGVPVCRRFTGGGAVYHDTGNLNVSLVARRDDPLVGDRLAGGLSGLYGAVLEPLAAAVRAVGVPAVPARRGLVVGERKLGGIAAWIGGRSVLVHATLLIDTDLSTLQRILAGPGAADDRRWQLTRSVRATVTSLARELDGADRARSSAWGELPEVIERDVVKAFRAAAGDRGRRDVVEEGLRATELAVAAGLLRSRYSKPAWHASGWFAEGR
jgi:lipoate-protein ligase A